MLSSTPSSSSSSSSSFFLTLTLRFGSATQQIAVDGRKEAQALEELSECARRFVSACGTANAHIALFRQHGNSSIQPISSLQHIRNGCVVDVVLLGDANASESHRLEVMSYKTPTFCDFCGELLIGLMKQGVKCTRCSANFHKKCVSLLRVGCSAQAPSSTSSPALTASSQPLPHNLLMHNFKTLTVCRVCDKMLLGIMKQGFRCRDCHVAVHRKCANELEDNCVLSRNAIIPRLNGMSMGESEEMMVGDDGLIPLARLPGQVTQEGKSAEKMEGWLIHFEMSDTERRLRHYWILLNDALTLYYEHASDTGVNPSRAYRCILLAEIVAVTPFEGEALDSNYPPHFFEIRTTSNVVYCVGERLTDSMGAPTSKVARHFSRSKMPTAAEWLQALRSALQPLPSTPQDSLDNSALQLAQLYQVLSENTLGSGQFGTVYGGIHRATGKQVAVKVISKERFSKRSASAESLRSEVGILQSISHPGIVCLECMFETNDNIFVVMEKMHGDMLEMILSQETGRLKERNTKFLMWQILTALRYLHSKGIAHCDLKPENVLLSTQSTQFPQTKLCDFGYARVIGEQQFRKTIVGTPAYLPPEVLQKKGYNKSIDLWSVGVIIYVTLSGTFPFNDGEDVQEQIENAAFMFPNELWNSISREAIDLIQKLLRVPMEERLPTEDCMAHPWLQSSQLHADICALESNLACKAYLSEGYGTPTQGCYGISASPQTPTYDGDNSLI